MLAVLMQEVPEIEHNLVKSAIHHQIAMARGCDDLGKPAARAVNRLSSQELALYQRSLPNPVPIVQPEPHDYSASTEHCLSE